MFLYIGPHSHLIVQIRQFFSNTPDCIRAIVINLMELNDPLAVKK